MAMVNGISSIPLEGDVVTRVVLPSHPNDNAADIYFASGKMIAAHFDMRDESEQTRRIRLVTYDPVSRKSDTEVWRHGDVSVLGLNVVAVVEGALCEPREGHQCGPCGALRRRLQSRLGIPSIQYVQTDPRRFAPED